MILKLFLKRNNRIFLWKPKICWLSKFCFNYHRISSKILDFPQRLKLKTQGFDKLRNDLTWHQLGGSDLNRSHKFKYPSWCWHHNFTFLPRTLSYLSMHPDKRKSAFDWHYIRYTWDKPLTFGEFATFTFRYVVVLDFARLHNLNRWKVE